jgi:hypothetical protein
MKETEKLLRSIPNVNRLYTARGGIVRAARTLVTDNVRKRAAVLRDAILSAGDGLADDKPLSYRRCQRPRMSIRRG